MNLTVKFARNAAFLLSKLFTSFLSLHISGYLAHPTVDVITKFLIKQHIYVFILNEGWPANSLLNIHEYKKHGLL